MSQRCCALRIIKSSKSNQKTSQNERLYANSCHTCRSTKRWVMNRVSLAVVVRLLKGFQSGLFALIKYLYPDGKSSANVSVFLSPDYMANKSWGKCLSFGQIRSFVSTFPLIQGFKLKRSAADETFPFSFPDCSLMVLILRSLCLNVFVNFLIWKTALACLSYENLYPNTSWLVEKRSKENKTFEF